MLTIKEWSVADRPREKLLEKGCSALTDAELLALILGSGTIHDTAVELAKKVLLAAHEDLKVIGRFELSDFLKHKGVGVAKAASVMAAFELARRHYTSGISTEGPIVSSKAVASLFHAKMIDLPYEEFWVLLLNRANKPIDMCKVSQGGVSATVIDSRLILRRAIERLASGIILCHNHPSGNVKPSEADISITKKLKVAASLVDMVVLDHVIIAPGSSYSFADEGIL